MKSSVSDEKLLSDYTNLQERVAEQQQIIDSQNEMLDEAQVLMQQLRVLFVFWLLKIGGTRRIGPRNPANEEPASNRLHARNPARFRHPRSAKQRNSLFSRIPTRRKP